MTSLFEYNKEEEEKKMREQGMEDGIELFIKTCLELGIEADIIKNKLITRFSLSSDEAEKYITKAK